MEDSSLSFISFISINDGVYTTETHDTRFSERRAVLDKLTAATEVYSTPSTNVKDSPEIWLMPHVVRPDRVTSDADLARLSG